VTQCRPASADVAAVQDYPLGQQMTYSL